MARRLHWTPAMENFSLSILVVAAAILIPLAGVVFFAFRARRLAGEVNRWRSQSASADRQHQVDAALAAERERITAKAAGELQLELDAARKQLSARDDEIRVQTGKIQSLETAAEKEREATASREQAIRRTREEFEERFKGIAAEVLQDNRQRFEANTKEKLGELSDQFGKQMFELKAKVEHAHSQDLKDRGELRGEIKKVVEASRRLDEDAANLTRTLKGDSQARGAWGEFVLETVLEQCGLREGAEYRRQQTFSNDENRRLRPDVIVDLPQGRSVVVDSKVSLSAYADFVSAEEESGRQEHLKAHIASLRGHVRDLAGKDYRNLNGLTANDCVLMFVPIESALAEAIRSDDELFSEAFRQGVIITTPTTLLATLRTIEQTWRLERQNETARAIVVQAAKLYDKFVAFTDALQGVGTRLDQAKVSYDSAVSRLTDGRGNLVRQVEQIRDLGVPAKKRVATELIERAGDGNVVIELGDPENDEDDTEAPAA